MILRRLLCCFTLAALLGPVWARAEDWPRWRGPGGNAVSSDSPLPLRWNSTEGIRWKTPIAGEGSSSPIVWDDHVYATSALDAGVRRLVHCLDKASGKVLWSREIKHAQPERTSSLTGHAAATPVTDGRHVVAFFGNAGAVCYDRTGKQLWHRDLGEFDTELGLASSPIVDGERVILLCDHDGDRFTSFDSFLIALDVRSGKELWKSERRGQFSSWSTPLVVSNPDGKRELIVNAQDQLHGHDPDSGKERWRWQGMTNWVTPSPVFGQGMIFAASGRNGPIVAVRPGGEGKVAAVWQHANGGPYVCSPLLYGELLYVLTEQGILSCFDAKTGKLHYRERLEGKFTTSPVGGDGKIYLTNEDGLTHVVQAGAKFVVLAKNALKESCLASLALAGRHLFVRTDRHLYCIAGE